MLRTSGCSPTTRQVGQPEIILGVIPGAGGTQRLTRLVGPARAKDIIFSGRFVGCVEALGSGSWMWSSPPSRCTRPRARWRSRTRRADDRVAGRQARDATADSACRSPTRLVFERELFVTLFATEDQKIGMSSFLEKGPGQAEFTGR